mgnify:CR=1 FL=1
MNEYMSQIKIVDEAFKVLKDTSGIQDIEEIMNTFIKSEEQNYSLYNYVNILTQTNDNLVSEIKTSQEELADLEVPFFLLLFAKSRY